MKGAFEGVRMMKKRAANLQRSAADPALALRLFDPFTATLEQAQALEEELRALGQAPARGPVVRACMAHEVIERRTFFEANPLDGVAACMVGDLVAPDWLARAYLKRFYAVRGCHVGSWDEAFGSPVPKGRRFAAMRRDRENRVQVWLLVDDFRKREPDAKIERLWEAFDADPNKEAIDLPADLAIRVKELRQRRVKSTKAQELLAQEQRLQAAAASGWGLADLLAPHVVRSPAKSQKLAGRRTSRRR